jgi:hypothetical protein
MVVRMPEGSDTGLTVSSDTMVVFGTEELIFPATAVAWPVRE